MEPKFKVGQELAYTATHKPYAIGAPMDIMIRDGVILYGFEHSGYIPEDSLQAI